MAKINLDKVTLVSIFVECTLYGKRTLRGDLCYYNILTRR